MELVPAPQDLEAVELVEEGRSLLLNRQPAGWYHGEHQLPGEATAALLARLGTIEATAFLPPGQDLLVAGLEQPWLTVRLGLSAGGLRLEVGRVVPQSLAEERGRSYHALLTPDPLSGEGALHLLLPEQAVVAILGARDRLLEVPEGH